MIWKNSFAAIEAVFGANAYAASVTSIVKTNVRKEKPTSVLLLLGFGLAAAGCLNLGTVDGSTGGTTTGSSGTTSSGGSGAVIEQWQAGVPETDAGYMLPSWLRITCGTTDRTSQWSASTVKRPFDNNAARPRNIGQGWGLTLESRRRNQIGTSDSWNDAGWLSPNGNMQMIHTPNNPDPSDGTKAGKFTIEPNRRSRYVNVPKGYATSWFLGGTDSNSFAHFVLTEGNAGWQYKTLPGMASWTRVELGVGSGDFFLDTAGEGGSGAPILNATTTLFAYGAQHETDGNGNAVNYPSSYIPTEGKDRIRDADTLYTDQAPTLLPNGYIHAIVKFAPHYAPGETSSLIHHILFITSTNSVRIELDKGIVTLVGTGNSLWGPPSGSLVWSREQELTVEVVIGPKQRMLSVSGATSGDFTVTDTADTPWPTTNEVYILGDSSGSQEGADLRYIGFFQPK